MPPRRGKQIPGTLMLDWQSSEVRASKPNIRRPKTACGPCRAVKVKCNGQQACERCRNRGLRCTYTPPPNTQHIQNAQNRNGNENAHISIESSAGMSTSTTTPIRSSQMMPATTLPTNPTTPDPMSVDLSGDIFSMTASGAIAAPSTDPSTGMEFNQALEQFDWVFPDTDLSFNNPQDNCQNDLDFFQNSTERMGQSGGDSESSTSDPLADPIALPRQVPTTKNCQCKVNMMMNIPKLDCAIRETPKPQLDKMFKVTGDVIRSCQESTRCGCYVGPVDLVCIMTVFEQTAACFDYIAKSGFDGTVKVGIGNYCVSKIDDASLKRMLVLDLVKQANELLDSVSKIAQNMVVAQSEPGVKRMGRSPACLNQLNLDYVREAIASFKKLFGLITNFFGEKDSKS